MSKTLKLDDGLSATRRLTTSYRWPQRTFLGICLALVVMLTAVPSHAINGPVKVSQFGAGVQVWFEAEGFDTRNPDTEEFFPVVDTPGAFGKAVTRVESAGGMLRYDFDIGEAGGSGGTWHFWGRVINPGNRSDYMLVDGDPEDTEIPTGPPFPGGNGTPPFVNTDDRIFERSVGPSFLWSRGDRQEGHVKQLRDGPNSMYVFHRQGDKTVFWDVFMWTNDPDYVASDADYLSAELRPRPKCTDAADTHCEAITVSGPEDSRVGIYTVTVDAVDDGGDQISYVLTADNGVAAPTIVRQTGNNVLQVFLGRGTWTISVTVDDDLFCEDASLDNTCSTDPFEVVGPGRVSSELTTNGGFEIVENTTAGGPDNVGQWFGDSSSIVVAQQGISPLEGDRMLHFMHSEPGGPSCSSFGSDVKQTIDVRPFREMIATGLAIASASAYFNRVTGDDQTDSQFQLQIAALANSPAASASVKRKERILSDRDPTTWELVTVDLVVPQNTEFLSLHTQATEDVFNDCSTPEFDGHYADNVSVRILSEPIPDSEIAQTSAHCVNFVLMNDEPIKGGELGIAFDPAAVIPSQVKPGPDFPPGGGIHFQLDAPISCQPGEGVEAGFTIGWLNPLTGSVLTPPGQHELLKICFRLASGAQVGDCSSLRFVQCLGVPAAPVRNVVTTADGVSIVLTPRDSEVCIGEDLMFRRGDFNADGSFDISDAIVILGCLFLGDDCPACLDAGDSNDDGLLNIADPVHLLRWRFTGGPEPLPPFLECGADATNDDLEECETFPLCQ